MSIGAMRVTGMLSRGLSQHNMLLPDGEHCHVIKSLQAWQGQHRAQRG